MMRRTLIIAMLSLVGGSLLPAAAEVAATCNGRAATIVAAAPAQVEGTDGDDVIVVTGDPLATIATTVGPVVVRAGAGNDLICLPGNAANVVVGGDGTDTVSYERAKQIVVATMNAAAVRFNADLSTLSPDVALSIVTGLAPGMDVLPLTEQLIGGPHADVLIGHALDADRISGRGGDDIIVGLFGNDSLFGEAGNDLVLGDGYDEFVYGPVDGITVGAVKTPVLAPDDDLLDGGAGSDALSDDTENNIFRGGDGNDGMAPGFGNDTMDGGAGGDHVSYAQRAARVDLNITTAQDTGHGMDTLRNVEHLTGSDGNDAFIGTNAVNVLLGGPGDDRLAGKIAESTAIDRIDGGAGTDVCHGLNRFNCECPTTPQSAMCAAPPYDWEAEDGAVSAP